MSEKREVPSNAALLLGLPGVNEPQYKPSGAKKPEAPGAKKRRKTKKKPVSKIVEK